MYDALSFAELEARHVGLLPPWYRPTAFHPPARWPPRPVGEHGGHEGALLGGRRMQGRRPSHTAGRSTNGGSRIELGRRVMQ